MDSNFTIRENRVWIAMIEGWTDENGQRIQHNHCMVRFYLPEKLLNGKLIENNRSQAIWFYLNGLDKFSTMTRDRMINAADLPKEVVEYIPWFQIRWGGEGKPATLETYKELELFGYTKEEVA